jgi:hypothetical protein
MVKSKTLTRLFKLFLIFMVLPAMVNGAAIGKWRRYKVQLQNSSYSGNPFELEIDAVFTHSATSTKITLPGYYDGNNTWEIGFMPTKTGDWTYVTSSSDSDLDNKTGTITCIESGNSGILKADPQNPRKWKYADGQYVVPTAFRFDVFQEAGSIARFTEIADFLQKDVQGHMLEFTFRNEVYSNHSALQFDLSLWNRLEDRMEVLTARGLGIHFMFYSDDAQAPNWGAQSLQEKLLFRYLMARLAGYPVLIINTGIDLAEYRSGSWVNWVRQEIGGLDPYVHPISSRIGGGSGNLRMSGETFYSRGDRQAYVNTMIGYFNSNNVPISMDDAWGELMEGYEFKSFRPTDIRRAMWKCVIAGGLGLIIRGSKITNSDAWFRMAPGVLQFEDDLESEQWIKLVNPFIKDKLGNTFGAMVPSSALVSNGYAMADAQKTKILIFLMGVNDKWDNGNGGAVTVKISSVSGKTYKATWFDTRTGNESSAGTLVSGKDHALNPPSTDDWVLLLDEGMTVETDFQGKVLKNQNIKVFPNPFRQGTEILVPHKESHPALLAVYDLKGKLIRNFSALDRKTKRLWWDARILPAGIYIVKSISGKQQLTKTVIHLN